MVWVAFKKMRDVLIVGVFSFLLLGCGTGGGDGSGPTAQSAEKGGQGQGGKKDDDQGGSGTDNPGSDQGGGQGGNQGGGQGGNQGSGSGNSGSGGSVGVVGETSDLPVSTALNAQQLSRVVYETQQDRFLVVWNDSRGVDGFNYQKWAVYGQFVNGVGDLTGQNFAISSLGVGYWTPPIVAHDPGSGRSFVAWETTGGDIFGRMVNKAGNFQGDVIPLAVSDEEYESIPAMSFDPIQNRYLVAWLSANSNYTVHGRLFDREGIPVGESFTISGVPSGKLELQVAADPINGRFLVVWRDYRGAISYSIRGQMVNGDGTLHGSERVIADATGMQIHPVLTYDMVNGCFLVTWFDTRRTGGASYEIYGQLVAADGFLLGPNFFISPYGGYSHSVAFDPSSKHYLITFSKFGGQIHGQFVAADGLVKDQDFPLTDSEGPQGSPHVAFGGPGKKFLAVWTDQRSGSQDIYGRADATEATPDACEEGGAVGGCLACETEGGAVVDLECPPTDPYDNHGDYVGCVTKAVKGLRKEGLINAECAIKLVDPRARSTVGKP